MKKPKFVATAFDTYTIGKKLGEGGSGVVYAATNQESNPFAVKFLKPERATADKRKRFKNEIVFCSRTDHENIVKVIEAGNHEGAPFFVMPLFGGSIHGRTTSLSPQAKVDVFLKIISGVEAAHLNGVLHRDLKPENVLCSNDMRRIAVTDFGIARFDDEEFYTAVETRHTDRLANFKYRAPEQMDRGGRLGPGTDIFALGLMLNEFFTNRIPAGSEYAVIESISPEHAYLDPIVASMIHQDIDRRFSSIEELKQELVKQANLQVSRQKLDRLNSRVVKAEEPTDPLISDPIRIVGADWNDDMLTATLNRDVTANWVHAFQNMGSFSYSSGTHPRNVGFHGKEARIGCMANYVQQTLDFLKGWITQTNKVYVQGVKEHAAKQEREHRQKLENQKKAEQQRQEVLSKLKL